MKRLIYFGFTEGKTKEQMYKEMMENNAAYEIEKPYMPKEYETKLTKNEIQRIMKQSGLSREVIEFLQAKNLKE